MVKLKQEPPNGQHDGFLVRTLLNMGEQGWIVTEVAEFESEESADRELKKFLEAHPNAIDLPPQFGNEDAFVEAVKRMRATGRFIDTP